MSALIENIRSTLQKLSIDWEWDLAYAPKPGQQRIKLTATHRREPHRKKVLILTEELVRKMPHFKLASNIVRLLPTLPESPAGEPPAPARDLAQPMKRVEIDLTARERYTQLQRLYRGTLQAVRAGSGPVATTPHRQHPDLSAALGKGLQRILQQLSRTVTTR